MKHLEIYERCIEILIRFLQFAPDEKIARILRQDGNIGKEISQDDPVLIESGDEQSGYVIPEYGNVDKSIREKFT